MSRRAAFKSGMCRHAVLALVALWLACAPANGQTLSGETLSGESLVAALRDGGYSIYFRHAATDWGQQDRIEAAGEWRSCDPDRMRQLSDEGRATAASIGEAIRALDIPVAEILTSEYCRARKTAEAMALGPVRQTTDIMNMRAADYVGGRDAAIANAQRILATPPSEGGNRVIVGHGNLMRAATGSYAAEGGAAVYAPSPDSDTGFVLVGEIAPADWSRLVATMGE